jgi:hypothetical protein
MNVFMEILLGVTGPCVGVLTAWVLMVRTFRRNPAGLTRLMMIAFAAKMIFFGAYVAFVLRVLPVRPIPFVVAFTSAFVVLYTMQAFALRRLLAGESRA